MRPDQILAAMAEVYAGCATYRDSGRVVTRFIGSGERRPRTVVKPFQTAYVRPDRFRFEYRHRYSDEDEWDRHIVWAHGAEVRTWWDITPGVTESESLGMALAGATGVSGGSARVIPSLLLPDWNGVWPSLLTEVSSIGDETIDSVSCYRLTGRFTPRRVDPAEEQEHRERVIRLTGRPGPAPATEGMTATGPIATRRAIDGPPATAPRRAAAASTGSRPSVSLCRRSWPAT